MKDKLFGMAAIAVLVLMIAAVGFASAQEESPVPSRTADEVADDSVTFRVRIQNISKESGVPVLFAPGVWVLHSEVAPFFTSGEADRGEGLENLAEDGDPTALAESLRATGVQSGVFNAPVCADGPGPIPSRVAVEFGSAYEFELTASPETPYLSFATMFTQSNDLFLAPAENGITLFDGDGAAIEVQDVTSKLLLWDAGTEANEKPGAGLNQAPRQPDPNTGPPDATEAVRPVDDGFNYPDVADMVQVYIVAARTVERDLKGQPPLPDLSIGQTFRIGSLQWRVLSAESLGHELRNEKGDRQTTDERFIQVRFHFLNLGSDPLEFQAINDLLARDNQWRLYQHYRLGRPWPRYPKEFIADPEECFGGQFGPIQRPYILKPNTPTTCTTIFEVKVDATGLALLASDMAEVENRKAAAVDLNLTPVPVHAIHEDFRVGDVRWKVLSAKSLGHVLEAHDAKAKTTGRFVRVRFQLLNKGSETLNFDVVEDVKLRDGQGRAHSHYLVDLIDPIGWRYPHEFIPDDEECPDLELKPNVLATCTSLYELPADATGVILIASDVSGRGAGAEGVNLSLPEQMTVHIYRIQADVEVGDMCWRALTVEDLGRDLKSNGETARTEGRFIQARMRILNLGSETLQYNGVSLVDAQGRSYKCGKQEVSTTVDEMCPNSFRLKPNAPTTCAAICEVPADARKFRLVASDLEGYEIEFISLLKSTPTVEIIHPGGPYPEVIPGIYRGQPPEGSYCYWARLNSLQHDPDSIIASALREGPFYVEIRESDAAFTTECELTLLEWVAHPDTRPTLVSVGMHLVGQDIAPGRYRGKAPADQHCFWQRLSCVTGDDGCSIEWDLPGGEYVVGVAPTDFAVEFGCPVERVE